MPLIAEMELIRIGNVIGVKKVQDLHGSQILETLKLVIWDL